MNEDNEGLSQYNNRQIVLILAGLLSLSLVIHAWSLLRFPAPHVDEAWLTSRAWSFIQTGHQIGMLDSGIVERYDHYWIVNQWTITALQSLVLRLAGAPLLLPLRVFSLLLGVALLGVTYAMARQLSESLTAALTALLLSISISFFYSSHLVRYDILAALLGYAGLALALWNRKGQFWPGLLAGLLSGLAVETHLNSLIFLPAVGIVFLFQYRLFFWRHRSFWGYTLGLLAGLFYYLALHYFPNPETYRSINGLLFNKTQQPPLLTFNPQKILEAFRSTGLLLFIATGPGIILAILGLVQLARTKTREAGLNVTLNLVMIITAALIIPNKSAHYAIYIAPILTLLTAVYIRKVLSQPWTGKLRGFIVRVLVFGLLAGSVALSLSPLGQDQSALFNLSIDKVKPALNQTDSIMGQQVYWFGMPERRFYSWELLFLYPRFHPGTTLVDSFAALKPDILIVDDELRKYITDSVDPNSFWSNYHISEKEFNQYLSQHASLIIDTQDEARGRIQVYRLKYDGMAIQDGSVK